MDIVYSDRVSRSARSFIAAFVAGFLAVLLFHQPVLAALSVSGFVKAGVFSLQATKPFGVPQVLSLAFWGGIWGLVFLLVQQRFPRGASYWLASFTFGAVFPTLVAWFIVATLKRQPAAAGRDIPRMVTALLINGAWGFGTALLLQLGSRAGLLHRS